jgi:hypothetical protein
MRASFFFMPKDERGCRVSDIMNLPEYRFLGGPPAEPERRAERLRYCAQGALWENDPIGHSDRQAGKFSLIG